MTELTKQVEEKGYTYVDWNSDSGDATGNNVPVDKIMANIRSGGTKASTMVVLMHDTDAKKPPPRHSLKLFSSIATRATALPGSQRTLPPCTTE